MQSEQSSQPAFPLSNTTSSRRRQSLSVAQTCYLAHTTRRKLSFEASRADHDLRVLVGHANFLDSLMVEIAEAKQEQARQSFPPVKEVTRVSEESRHRQLSASTVVEKPVDDWEVWESDESDSSDSDSGDDKGEDVDITKAIPSRPVLGRSDTFVESREVGEDDEEDDYGDLALVRTLSHSPPQLILGSYA